MHTVTRTALLCLFLSAGGMVPASAAGLSFLDVGAVSKHVGEVDPTWHPNETHECLGGEVPADWAGWSYRATYCRDSYDTNAWMAGARYASRLGTLAGLRLGWAVDVGAVNKTLLDDEGRAVRRTLPALLPEVTASLPGKLRVGLAYVPPLGGKYKTGTFLARFSIPIK